MKKILNNGQKFLTPKGIRTPKYIWVGKDSEGYEIKDITKRGLINSISRNNRIFPISTPDPVND